MSERWKKQLKVGLSWGGFMTLAITIYLTVTTEVYRFEFFFKIAQLALLYFTVGIFVIGYFSWKKSQQSAS